MATEEDVKKPDTDDASGESPDEAEDREAPPSGEGGIRLAEAAPEEVADDVAKSEAEAEEAAAEDGGAPVQLGYKRYVYAAYMAFAMLVAFLAAKIGHTAWYRLGQWKPQLGEPQDEILFPLAAIVGVAVALYYWRRPQSREYVNDVAEELSKVTWPSRKEVTNSTTVVVVATLFATVFFALMDRFWGFVTDHIYSF